MVASAVTDAPDLIPFAYGLVYTLPKTCKEKRDKCVRVARAMAGAAKMIQEKPDEVFETSEEALRQDGSGAAGGGLEGGAQAHAKDIRVTVARPGELPEGEPRGEAARPQGRAQELRGALYG